MAVVFPPSPTVGETVTDSATGAVWEWDGAKWVAGPVPPLNVVTSITAGTGLTGGTITDEGTIGLATPVSIANGGTSGTTALAARTGLSVNNLFFQFNWPGTPIPIGVQSRLIIPFASQTAPIGMGINYSFGVGPGSNNISLQMLTQVGNNAPVVFAGYPLNLQSGATAIGAASSPFAQNTVLIANLTGTGDPNAADLVVLVQLTRTA